MALTDTQKTSIRRHLGLNAASPALYPWVPTFYTVTQILDTLPVATEAEVAAILARLDALEETLDSASNQRLKAAKVGSITLRVDETDRLWVEIKRWRRELSTITGIPIIPSGGGGILVV